jgi:hypothetical protein
MNWQGKWIWLSAAADDAQSTLLARRSFPLDAVPQSATLHISANFIYQLYVNGQVVGRGPDRADPRYPYYDTYDVAEHLVAGENVLLCLVYHFRADAERNRAWALYDGEPGLLAQLHVDEEVLVTDNAWKMRRAPGWRECGEPVSRFVGPRHCVDLGAARGMAPMAAPGYDDSGWSAATAQPFAPDGPLPEPIPREIPFLRRVVRTPVHLGSICPAQRAVDNARALLGFAPDEAPCTIAPQPEGAWLTLDFGRPMGGFPEVVFEAQGGEVDLYYAEDGEYLLADRLILQADGVATFEPLDWRGARYVALHFRELAGPCIVRSARFIEMVYPFQERGLFRCSDDTLTKVWEICRTTAWAGTKDHPVDCLNREQALWIGDINIHAGAMAACFGDVQPAVKAVRQTVRVIHEDGVVPVPGPVALSYDRSAEMLPWSGQALNLALILQKIYWHNGDLELLAESLPKLEKTYAFFQAYEDERGLLRTHVHGRPDLWAFCGWNTMLKEGVPAVLNFQYACSLAAAAELQGAIGATDRAARLEQRADRVRAACREAFWDAERKLYRDGERDGKPVVAYSPTVNAWAAMAGCVVPRDAGSWAEAIRNDPDVIDPASPFDASHLLNAFVALDQELHVRWLLDRYFGGIARAGLPTLPEFWYPDDRAGGLTKNHWSHCHPYGSAPAYQCLNYILGARPLEPGWTRAIVSPRSLGLSHAEGRVPTPLGELGVRWEREDGQWRVEIDVPTAMTVDVALPRFCWAGTRLTVNDAVVEAYALVTDYHAQWARTANSGRPREACCTINTPGRHIVRFEAC